LYNARINPIWENENVGIAVFGARTLSKNTEWRHINAVRLFQFVEKSLFGPSFAFTFEGNDEALWSRATFVIESFLLSLFNQGYFSGRTPEEAFFVKCDKENNPPELREQGYLFIDIGLSYRRPAEFIVMRYRIKTLS
jgi:phage tail sheath protein FI